MSSLIKSLSCALLLFLSNLSGSEHSLDTEAECISQFPHKFASPHPSGLSFVINDNGEAAWTEVNPVHPESRNVAEQFFYWSKDDGTLEIDIDDVMHNLGFIKGERGSIKAHGYHVTSMKLGNSGNVFLFIDIDIRKTMPSAPYEFLKKIGVWNKKYGFKMLNIPNIDSVKEIKFSNDLIFVKGMNLAWDETFVVLKPTSGHWPWELESKVVEEPIKLPPETTPWDTLPFGKHGARLHIIQQLLKSTKSSAEKTTLMLMIDNEIANMLDLLQYDLKRSQTLLKKAKNDGKEDPEAEQLHANTQKHITALKGYLKSLPKANRTRVDAINFPSKAWSPKP